MSWTTSSVTLPITPPVTHPVTQSSQDTFNGINLQSGYATTTAEICGRTSCGQTNSQIASSGVDAFEAIPINDTSISNIWKGLKRLLTSWIRWQITAGTLLGSFRDGDAMPWDDNIDRRIHKDDWYIIQSVYAKAKSNGPIALSLW